MMVMVMMMMMITIAVVVVEVVVELEVVVSAAEKMTQTGKKRMEKRRKEQINGTFNIECNRKCYVYIGTYKDVTTKHQQIRSLPKRLAQRALLIDNLEKNKMNK